MSSIIWCEDSKSGYEFWKLLFQTIKPDYIVETKKNNTGLRKAASKIDDDDNSYYVIVDQVVDNPEVVREIKELYKIKEKKNNMDLIKVHSFEGVLLSFTDLEKWIFAEEDELREQRKALLQQKNFFVKSVIYGGMTSDVTELYTLMNTMDCNTTEQLAAKLLFNITRNTGFETDKRTLGECFKNDCCEWEERQDDDICGLDNNKLCLREKIDAIARNSAVTDELIRIGII